MKKICWGIVGLLLLSVPAWAQEYKNDKALAGLKEVKAYFDVNVGQPEKLLTRLLLIYKTFNQLQETGVKPDFVIGFRGAASAFVTEGKRYVDEEFLPEKEKVQSWIGQFSELGIHMEQCHLANSMLHIDSAHVLPAIQVVANGYISMMGYQLKGYAFIPMD